MSRTRRIFLFFVVAILTVAAVFGAFGWQKNQAQTILRGGNEEYYQDIRGALAEVNLPKTDNSAEINAVAERLDKFFNYRANVKLNRANKNLLVELETKSWQQSKKINTGDFVRILSDAAILRTTNATDADIERIAKILSGCKCHKSDDKLLETKYVMMRISGARWFEPDDFIEQVKILRDTVKSNRIAQSFVVNGIRQELNQRIELLAAADPKNFAAARNSLTPAQAILLTYAIVTDDTLSWNQKQLEHQMNDLYKIFLNSDPASPDPKNFHAFGENGYIFSSPADFLLDDATMTMILEGIRTKSGVQ